MLNQLPSMKDIVDTSEDLKLNVMDLVSKDPPISHLKPRHSVKPWIDGIQQNTIPGLVTKNDSCATK